LSTDSGCVGQQIPYSYENHLTITAGGGVASDAIWDPGDNSPIEPVLQAQDGSYVGTHRSSTPGIIAFDQSGNIKWSVPNDYPEIATADGGVIGASGITYDSNGNATGKAANDVQSWTSNLYQESSQAVSLVVAPPVIPATPPSWSFPGANQSPNGASPLCRSDLDQFLVEYVTVFPPATVNAGFMPTCQQFWSEIMYSSTRDAVIFPFSVLNQDDIKASDHPNWALLQQSLLNGMFNIELAIGGPITISSAYRSPKIQNQIDQEAIQKYYNKHPGGHDPPSPSPQSEHLHGDAVDMSTNSVQDPQDAQDVWDSLHNAALTAGACVEPERESTVNHVHADWRRVCPNKKWRE
jgi:hypothetical protein